MTNIFVSVAVGAIFTAFSLGTISYFIEDELFSGGGNWIGPAKEPLEFKVILVAVYGAIVGTITGGISYSFNLKIVPGASLGLFISIVFGAFIYLYLGSSWGSGMTKIFYASIVVGLITGMIVSFLNASPKPLN